MSSRVLALVAATSSLAIVSCGARTELGDGGGGGSGGETIASTAVTSTTTTAVSSVSSVVSTSVSTGSQMGCEDPDTLLVYVITEAQHLFRFDPPTGAFTFVGDVDCGPLPPDVTPYSMAVDRKGVAYVLFTDGEISEIDKATATIVSQTHIPVGDPQNAFAYAYWGGSFYLFTALVNDGTTFVNRYNPVDMSITRSRA